MAVSIPAHILHITAHCTALPLHVTHTHTHTFNGPFSGTTQVSRYQKRKTNLDFTEATDSEWQWHQLGYMQVCTSLQSYNHASTPPLSFLQAGCPSCRPTNSVSVKASRSMLTLLKSENFFPVLLQPHTMHANFVYTHKNDTVVEN